MTKIYEIGLTDYADKRSIMRADLAVRGIAHFNLEETIDTGMLLFNHEDAALVRLLGWDIVTHDLTEFVMNEIIAYEIEESKDSEVEAVHYAK